MTTTTPTTQLDLPGQAHVATGPHDMNGMYLMHHAFRRDLRRLQSAVRGTPVGDAATWAALTRRWGRFTDVLHHHHSAEDDAVWPVLLRRVDERGDARARATLEAMEAEHDAIDPALRSCTDGFAAMVAHPCEDHRNALDVHVTAFRESLLEHLSHEESGALPVYQSVVTAEDNVAIEKALERAYPARLMPFLLPWLAEGLPEEGTRCLREIAGPVLSLLLTVLGGSFRKGERRAFHHA
ncbi:hypothetical protein GCM10009623_15670 [Nocardioides aestuarii]|uniref:Hemerythrin domain-containing protein n=1 Tax=Nocardioides aestuarii TaxID=252231 RepID=A0ABW4TLE4_9ACTN